MKRVEALIICRYYEAGIHHATLEFENEKGTCKMECCAD